MPALFASCSNGCPVGVSSRPGLKLSHLSAAVSNLVWSLRASSRKTAETAANLAFVFGKIVADVGDLEGAEDRSVRLTFEQEHRRERFERNPHGSSSAVTPRLTHRNSDVPQHPNIQDVTELKPSDQLASGTEIEAHLRLENRRLTSPKPQSCCSPNLHKPQVLRAKCSFVFDHCSLINHPV